MFGQVSAESRKTMTRGEKIQRAIQVLGLSSIVIGAALPLLAQPREALISERFMGEAGAGAIEAVTGARSSFARGVIDAAGGVESFEDQARAHAVWTMLTVDGRNLAWHAAGHDWQEREQMEEEEILDFSEEVVARNEALRQPMELAAYDLAGAGIAPGMARVLGGVAALVGLSDGLGSGFPADKDILGAARKAVAEKEAPIRGRMEEAVQAVAKVAREQGHETDLMRAVARDIDRAVEDHIGGRHGRIIEAMTGESEPSPRIEVAESEPGGPTST